MTRQKNLKANDIILKCMNKYWEKGINNFSFNEIIYHSGVSKPSVYRLIGDENTLKSKSIILYYENIIKKNHDIIENFPNFYNFIYKTLVNVEKKKDGLADHDKGLCYFQKTRIIKYRCDKKIRLVIDQIDKKFINSYKILINKSKARNQLNKSLDTEYLAQITYNNITFFINTILNSPYQKNISYRKNNILDTIKRYTI